MKTNGIGIGALGAGGFGLFALQHFTQLPGVKLLGMAETHREAALTMARRFNLPHFQTADALLAHADINLVYIATPPFLHYPQAMQALRAGKHVICEKPLALELSQADEMIALAQAKHLLVIANLMQRYNPMFALVRRLIETRLLGEVLHGYFENYASDEGLGPEHWFWDRTKSGGIFVEHGVHFFDLFEGWLGPGRVVAAQRTLRPGSRIEEQVTCAVRYRDGILVNFYHGFTQPSRLDRQEFRLLFEHGEVTLEEWVPTRARIRALVNEEQTRELLELFPGAQLDILNSYGGSSRAVRARHKSIDVCQKIEVNYGLADDKMQRYGELLRSMLGDQTQWICDRTHRRKVTHENGRNSLALAVEAMKLADNSP
jgi:predicted dehydrogenase